jgi:hypothetical protein
MSTTIIPPESKVEEPQARLERLFIEAYLRIRGHTRHSLHELPEEEAKRLLMEASMYASARLAEVETRSRFVQDVHGVSQA